MPTFEDREKEFETRFKHDEELRFKVTARRNRLVGLWAAEKMGQKRLPFILKRKLAMARCVVRPDPEIFELIRCPQPSSALSGEFELSVAKEVSEADT